MSLCDFCKNSAKYIFTCPKCGKTFCKDHRKPENHTCLNSETVQDTQEKNTYHPEEHVINEEYKPGYTIEENVDLDSVIFVDIPYIHPSQPSYSFIPFLIIILVSIISLLLIGVLFKQKIDMNILNQKAEILSKFLSEYFNHN